MTTWTGVKVARATVEDEITSAAAPVVESKFKVLLDAPLEFSIQQVCSSDDGHKSIRRSAKNSVTAVKKALMADAETTPVFAERLKAKLSTSIGLKCKHYTKATLAGVAYTHAMLLARRWAALQPSKDADTPAGRKEVLLQQAQLVVGEELKAELLETAKPKKG